MAAQTASSEPTLRRVESDALQAACPDPVNPAARDAAKAILADVKANGEQALLANAVRLGDIAAGDAHLKTKEECEAAYNALPADQQGVLDRTAARIRTFAEAQLASVTSTEIDIPGGRAGHTIAPVNAAGCYAPGGRYPLPSSVLMTAVTARTAGCTQVWVASPRPTEVTMAAAYVAGADGLLAVGGAQAIAALAYGVGGVPPCDVIVGPGNMWVTAAKSLVAGLCAIDMLAGPSEVLVIADGSANPKIVAADLLAQAEHDTEARPILVCTDEGLIDAINTEVQEQLAVLPTAPVAREAVKKGFAVLVSDVDAAIAISNRVGPEHLEIQTEDADGVGKRCTNYGGLFVGERAAEVMGDYGAGPNHVLPTGGTSKYSGGLSVFNFIRIRTWMRIDDAQSSQTLVQDSVALARLEGLEGHARAAECRLEPDDAPDAKRSRNS